MLLRDLRLSSFYSFFFGKIAAENCQEQENIRNLLASTSILIITVEMPKVFESGVSKRICVPAEELSKVKSFLGKG